MDDKQRAERIRTLNDRLRYHHQGGKVMLTSGIAALDLGIQTRILTAVARFNDFNGDNDPYGEHDCAVMKVEDHKIIWKIDYYDKTMTWGSEDPADPAKTTRVLTVMLAAEY
ncbi:MAG: DUF3768 domain-containing protein [Magnetospiraceae bacterium]